MYMLGSEINQISNVVFENNNKQVTEARCWFFLNSFIEMYYNIYITINYY